MAEKFHLVLLIHAHQPVGNFDAVLERAYRQSYLAFVKHLSRHLGVRLGLHFSGPLLAWIEAHHPEYFELLRELGEREQVELVGGGFHEPILVSIPPRDQKTQIGKMNDYLERHFGRRPAGAWLAERVWEPQLPSVLAPAGVEYTLVDDIHFLSAGFEPHQLFGSYVAEDAGKTLTLLPGLKSLRYLLPFRSVEDAINCLRDAAGSHPGGMAAMGDDCEKFGVWPGTYEHCYRDGWLERFFSALEANSDWLAVTPPREYLAAHRPLGRADLPTASYTEMMEWVLPTGVRQRFHAVQREFVSRPDVQEFLRGGSWRGFFTKYAEANLLHKKMLYVSRRVEALRRARGASLSRSSNVRAQEHVLRAQCNDAYWHGIFGGLYAPHLRTALWRELIRAEKIADSREQPRANVARVERLDFDTDGAEELYFTSCAYSALVKSGDGATLALVDARGSEATLINSIMRRPEAYHARLRDAAAGSPGGIASIHEQTRVKEEGLERRLRYDRWPRHAFRLLLFPHGKSHADYEALCLEEDASFAGGAYRVLSAARRRAEFACEGRLSCGAHNRAAELPLRVAKTFQFSETARGFEIACDITLVSEVASAGPLAVGLESVINLLAPDEPDRYFEIRGERHPLGWSASVPASPLQMTDGWQRLRVTLEAPGAREFWIAPIETVSESEEGFERVYQGSQILAVWTADWASQNTWSARLVWRIDSL